MGTLYIVGTPIGNLGDFSPRAIEILKTVDFIAAEDTRVTLKLLNHFEIRNTLISYHEHNAAASGLPTGKFLFEGFLPIKKGERDAALQAVSRLPHTLIFYEAPHRLRQTLAALLEGLGDRPITLCRELTKLHEEMQRTTLAAAVAEYAEREPRGEYVLIIAGAAVNEATAQMSLEQAAALVRRLAREGQSLSDAAKQVAKETGYRKGELYRLALESD